MRSEAFFSDTLTRTFNVVVPSSAPLLQDPTFAFARFRVSADGGTLPTGLATSGEVEDYRVTLLPNSTPPVVTSPIPPQSMLEDAPSLRLSLLPYFQDPNNFDILTFSASSVIQARRSSLSTARIWLYCRG